MKKKTKISIILPVFQDQASLSKRLDELKAQESEPSWDLVVVDDGSETPLSLGSNPEPNWVLERNETRQGAAFSRNRGASKARGEYFIFLSVFLQIPANYLNTILAFIQDHDPVYAQHSLVLSPTLTATHFQAFLVSSEKRVHDQGGQLSIKQSLFTAALIKAKVFQEAQGFDEEMQHYGGHEMDLIYRLSQSGYHQRQLIENCPLQREVVSDHKTIQRRLREYGKTGLPNLLKKHPKLKKDILVYPAIWDLTGFFGLHKLFESAIARKIDADKALSTATYRLYLHLLMRNAWDAR
jgi:glycosyltransferase involved in cell wall biosynthesis